MSAAVQHRDRSRSAADIVREAARDGVPIGDELFDAMYSARAQVLSPDFWTPLEAADLALSLLVRSREGDRILDIGAGVGKLCIYGALKSPGARFVGIEHRRDLVEEGRRVAAALGVGDRVDLRHGAVATFDPRGFDAWYLFNPFGENFTDEPIDRRVRLARDQHARDVHRVQKWLREAAIGTRVVTLHGFGGEFPDTFDLQAFGPAGRSVLCAWDKRRDGDEPWL